MKIGILGSGMVGQTFGTKLVELGHDVVIGARDITKLGEWLESVNHKARASSFAEAAEHGEFVINATSGSGALDALSLAGAENLDGKIFIDISNPLDFSQGMPPSLFISNTDSLGEQIQRVFPNVKVVKTLNTLSEYLMVDPGQLADGEHSIFVSGNDSDAKAKVVDTLKSWFGWRDVIDLGDITTARGTEMLLPVLFRLGGALGTPMFNFKVVR